MFIATFLKQYDKKWEADRGFVFYDYKQPEDVPEALKGSFDLIVVDPPFITEEVWAKYTTTIKLLLKEGVNDENIPHGKMILTTLFENAEMMGRLLGAKSTVSSLPNSNVMLPSSTMLSISVLFQSNICFIYS